MTEQEAHERVAALKAFYQEALAAGGLNIFMILIWVMSGAGYFWPLWTILFSVTQLGYKALKFGLLPELISYLPFLSPEWEKKKIDQLTSKKEG